MHWYAIKPSQPTNLNGKEPGLSYYLSWAEGKWTSGFIPSNGHWSERKRKQLRVELELDSSSLFPKTITVTPSISTHSERKLHRLYNCGRFFFFIYYHFSLVISYHSVWLGLELFSLVHVQLHTLSAGVHARVRRMWQPQMS